MRQHLNLDLYLRHLRSLLTVFSIRGYLKYTQTPGAPRAITVSTAPPLMS
jgi:hypothetical protein